VELDRIRNLTNVKRHRQEICEAIGIEFSEEMLTDDYFLGRFSGQQRDYLDSRDLVNQGFCPLCGAEPITTDYHRGLAFSKAVEYLCKECWTRTNPHLTIPGYTRRYYTGKFIMWMVLISFLAGAFLIVRACVSKFL